jgi:hypothetical protein
MLRRVLTVIAFLFLGLPIVATAQPYGSQSPVGLPVFHFTDGGTHCAGKAFAIQWFRNRKLLLMPLHLLGPGGGYPTYILPQNVPEAVKSVDVMSLSGDRLIVTAKPGLLRTGTPCEKASGNLSEDLMAFELPSSCQLPLLPLSRALVPVGTRVWVLSKVTPAKDNSPDRYPGKVVSAFPTGVTIVMDSPLTALASSGAPIVNSQNELVAMMVGKSGDRRIVIMGAPSTSLYQKLYRELSH